jgi:hypothetical protein
MIRDRSVSKDDLPAAREAIRGYLAYLRAKGKDPKEHPYWATRVARGFSDAGVPVRVKETE